MLLLLHDRWMHSPVFNETLYHFFVFFFWVFCVWMFGYIGQKTVSRIMYTLYLWVYTEDECTKWKSTVDHKPIKGFVTHLKWDTLYSLASSITYKHVPPSPTIAMDHRIFKHFICLHIGLLMLHFSPFCDINKNKNYYLLYIQSTSIYHYLFYETIGNDYASHLKNNDCTL